MNLIRPTWRRPIIKQGLREPHSALGQMRRTGSMLHNQRKHSIARKVGDGDAGNRLCILCTVPSPRPFAQAPAWIEACE